MKVFLSWSGTTSRKVAEALHDWLPCVIQECRPFISSGDIIKGIRWNDTLIKELHDAQYGIVCVTPFNLFSPWLNYETGALTNAIHTNNVSPFLLFLTPSALREPIAQFQATVYDPINDPDGKDVLRLVNSLNQKLPKKRRVSHDVLLATFNKWWSDLQEKLKGITQGPEERRTCMPWLFTLEDVVQIRNPNPGRVIIATRNLWKHTLESPCHEFVLAGRDKDVEFDIIFDSSDNRNEANRKTLQNEFKDRLKQLHLIPINSKEFARQVVSDFIILIPSDDKERDPATSDNTTGDNKESELTSRSNKENAPITNSNMESDSTPNNHKERGLEAYVKVPIENCEYWFKADGQAATGFRDRFDELKTRFEKERKRQPTHKTDEIVGSESPVQ